MVIPCTELKSENFKANLELPIPMCNIFFLYLSNTNDLLTPFHLMFDLYSPITIILIFYRVFFFTTANIFKRHSIFFPKFYIFVESVNFNKEFKHFIVFINWNSWQ